MPPQMHCSACCHPHPMGVPSRGGTLQASLSAQRRTGRRGPGGVCGVRGAVVSGVTGHRGGLTSWAGSAAGVMPTPTYARCLRTPLSPGWNGHPPLHRCRQGPRAIVCRMPPGGSVRPEAGCHGSHLHPAHSQAGALRMWTWLLTQPQGTLRPAAPGFLVAQGPRGYSQPQFLQQA